MNVININFGDKVRVKNNELQITNDDIISLVPISEVEVLIIENPACSLSGAVNVLCIENNVPIIYCDSKRTPICVSTGYNTYYKQLERLKEQIKWSSIKKQKYFRKIIEQKINNQVNLLEHLEIKQVQIDKMKKLLENLNVENVDIIEANVAKIYFKALFGDDFIRHNDDEINYALNYGYAILRSKIKLKIVAKGLHPTLGVWHKSQFNNYNLSDDIIEVYRSMVDYVVYIYLIKDDKFTKDEKNFLQRTIFQKVLFEEKEYDFNISIDYFIDNMINFLNNSSNKITIPVLDCDLYEY